MNFRTPSLRGTLLALAVVVAVGTPTVSGAADKDVVVTNDATQPVPVTVQGTAVEVRPGAGPVAFSAYTGFLPGPGRKSLFGPIPADKKLVIGSAWFANNSHTESQSVFVRPARIAEGGTDCRDLDPVSFQPLFFTLSPQENLVLNFPQPLVLPAVAPDTEWCLTVEWLGGDTRVNFALVTGYVQ